MSPFWSFATPSPRNGLKKNDHQPAFCDVFCETFWKSKPCGRPRFLVESLETRIFWAILDAEKPVGFQTPWVWRKNLDPKKPHQKGLLRLGIMRRMSEPRMPNAWLLAMEDWSSLNAKDQVWHYKSRSDPIPFGMQCFTYYQTIETGLGDYLHYKPHPYYMNGSSHVDLVFRRVPPPLLLNMEFGDMDDKKLVTVRAMSGAVLQVLEYDREWFPPGSKNLSTSQKMFVRLWVWKNHQQFLRINSGFNYGRLWWLLRGIQMFRSEFPIFMRPPADTIR